ADGVRRPLVEGRALLALLACARDGLSASAFAEYLSLGVVPGPADAPDAARAADAVPSPRKWERMLVEAAVIGGRDRWARRLAGLSASLAAEASLLEPDDPRYAELARERQQLAGLESFALPLLDRLEALPEGGTWGSWIAALSRLAREALREPDAVLALLEELAPLSPLGPVTVRTVHRVLAPRLSSVVRTDAGLGAGKLFVGSIDDARGRAFEMVFVPGLAERLFPPRIAEDALLPDALREKLGAELLVTDERVARERLLLRLAVGAAERALWLSFPRFDLAHARPRVPSFYGLEVLEAIDGSLPAYDELTRRALPGAAARMGFPAPDAPEDAIDDAEYDLAMLARVMRAPPAERAGAARYLLEASAPLARALRFRARRWETARFTVVDGFVAGDEASRALLAPERLSQRAYSASALAHFAVCPYRFYLHAIVGLAPRPELLGADELDARQRGVLFHRVQRALLERLRAEGLLPLRAPGLPEAHARLDEVFEAHARAARDDFAPSIDRVFEACLSALRTDLRAWLDQLAAETRYAPRWFELGFGLPRAEERDAHSRTEPVVLPLGLRLRGAIDLVEVAQPEGEPRRLRATDHKTSAAPAKLGTIAGGRSLQPLLYALALEQMFPEAQVVAGRLFFCTARGEFKTHEVRLDDTARAIARDLIAGIDAMIDHACLPAAPAPQPEDRNRGECDRCPYQVVCGPHERERVAFVKHDDLKRLAPLFMVRNLP
ncbi:MAG: PD-(D/E)XK nuclease family protein, partial [Polyangiales bacterium]